MPSRRSLLGFFLLLLVALYPEASKACPVGATCVGEVDFAFDCFESVPTQSCISLGVFTDGSLTLPAGVSASSDGLFLGGWGFDVFQGSGSLVIDGPGASLTIAGHDLPALPAVNGLLVSEGSLEVLNGGQLLVNGSSFLAAFSGGTSYVRVAGTGSRMEFLNGLRVGGGNSFWGTGPTHVDLEVGTGATLVSRALYIARPGTSASVLIEQGATVEIADVPPGAGGPVVVGDGGAGALTMEPGSTMTGTWLFLASGGRLIGSGNLDFGNALQSGGALEPGDAGSVGTFTVTGYFDLQGGSILVDVLDDAGSVSHDVLDVGLSANLTGGEIRIDVDPSILLPTTISPIKTTINVELNGVVISATRSGQPIPVAVTVNASSDLDITLLEPSPVPALGPFALSLLVVLLPASAAAWLRIARRR